MSNIGAQIGATNATWVGNTSALGSVALGSVDSFPYASGRNGMIVFRGLIEVEKAANGFVVRMGTRQGDIATTYVAKDVAEVNGIITAEMVKFKLEDK